MFSLSWDASQLLSTHPFVSLCWDASQVPTTIHPIFVGIFDFTFGPSAFGLIAFGLTAFGKLLLENCVWKTAFGFLLFDNCVTPLGRGMRQSKKKNLSHILD